MQATGQLEVALGGSSPSLEESRTTRFIDSRLSADMNSNQLSLILNFFLVAHCQTARCNRMRYIQ